MAFTFYIDPAYNDFRVSGNTLLLANGIDAIRQQIEVAIKTELGEWYLNINNGIPYYGSGTQNNNNMTGILGGNYSAAEIGAVFRKVILETPGVISIKTFDLVQESGTDSIKINSQVVVQPSDASGIGTQSVEIVEVSN